MRRQGNRIVVLSVVLTLASFATSQQLPEPLSDAYAALGKPFWWTCSSPRTGQSTSLVFIWRFQDQDMAQDQTRINYGNGTLYFPQVLSSQLGQYTCIVYDNQGPTESKAWLREAYLSGISIKPSNQSVKVGDAVVLDCTCDGQPPPSLDWLVNGVKVVQSSRMHINQVRAGYSILQIMNTTYTDAGNYTCVVSHITLNQALSSTPAVVIVYGVPVLWMVSLDQAVPVRYNVTFYCQAYSQPPAKVVWIFKSLSPSDPQLKLSTSLPSMSIDGISGTLRLFNVSETYSGTYSCTWTNTYGSAASRSNLIVAGQPQAPNVAVRPVDTSLVQGNDLHLSCNGTGNPAPQVVWVTPSGAILSGSAFQQNADQPVAVNGSRLMNEDRATVGNDGSLMLRNATVNDIGVYTCRLVSPEGSPEFRAVVDVLYAPSFTLLPQSVNVSYGSPFTLSCSAAGNPKPTFSWTLPRNPGVNLTALNSGANTNSNEVVLDNGQLSVKKAGSTHRGVFTCYASNQIGSSAVSATVSVSGGLYFTVIPKSQLLIEGDNVILESQIDVYPAVSVAWFHTYMVDLSIQSTDIAQLKQTLSMSKNPVENMTFIQTYQNSKYSLVNGTSLQIVNITEHDAGLYICLATNGAGSEFETAILRVLTLPSFLVPPKDTRAALGSTAVLDCLSVGIPVPTQMWSFNNIKVNNTSRTSLYTNGSLSIKDIQESDFGVYTCLANNQVGPRAFSATLSLSKLPYLSRPPLNTTTASGSQVSMPCRGNSSTNMEVSWYLSDVDGTPVRLLGYTVVSVASLQQGPSGGVNIQQSQGSRIQISPEGDLVFQCVSVSDSSWYMCSIKNSDGTTNSGPAFLTVSYLPSQMVIDVPEKVYVGNTANMTCQAQGLPTPTIYWLSPLKVQYSAGNSGDVTVALAQTSTLVISTVNIVNLQMYRDAGEWICKACNVVGCRLQRSILNIEGSAVIRQIAVQEYNSEYSISCLPAGSPEPNITYTLNGISIGNLTDGHTIVNGALIVQKDKIGTEYTCTATNVYGSFSVSMSKPQGAVIRSVNASSTSFLVSLVYAEPIPSLMLNEVLLQFEIIGTNTWENHTLFLSQDIGNYLQVEMGAVDSNYTAASCESNSGNIVKRAVGTDTSSLEDKVSVSSNGTHFLYSFDANIQNLKPSTNYVLKLAVGNILGLGTNSSLLSAMTLAAAPAPVSDVTVSVRNRTATVTWSLPGPLNGMPEVTYVTVQLFNSSQNLVNVTYVGVNIYHVNFPNLQLGPYTLQIFVSNRQTNTSSNVNVAAFQVEDDKPDFIPRIDQIRAKNTNQIWLNWTLPLNSNTPVTGYRIEVWVMNDSNDTQLFNIDGASTSESIIDNLKEHTLYSVRLASRNNAGIGPYSEPRNVTTTYSNNTFSQNAQGDSSPLTVTIVILVLVLVAIVAATVAVITVHQRKGAKTRSVDLVRNQEPDDLSSNSVEEEMRHNSSARTVEGVENEGFILY